MRNCSFDGSDLTDVEIIKSDLSGTTFEKCKD